MTEIEPVTNHLSVISIQIDGEKAARIESTLSNTAADLRAILISQDIQIPLNGHFLDAKDYPVLVMNEKSIRISDLVVSTNDGDTIKLKTNERSTNVVTPRPARISVKNFVIIITTLCLAYYISTNGNLKATLRAQLSSDIRDDFIDQNTSDYLGQQITDVKEGQEIFVDRETNMEKVQLSAHTHDSVEMYNDWIKNEAKYRADYEWYNNMKSETGHCAGHFDEKVMHSNKLIRDTPESIKKFTENAFHDWPQKLKVKINIENELEGAANDDGGEFSLDTNGKISTNLYLVAWKRDGNETIRIHTYVTIFERTAGHGCHFNPSYWSGKKDQIANAKKYFLLSKIKSNPVYKTFLLGNRRS